MAVARDTETRFPVTADTSDTTTGDRTFSHVCAATSAGAAVIIANLSTSAVVTGVLYGGVAMTLTQTASDTSEAGRIDIYTLAGSSFPADDQTVTLQGCTATEKWCTCVTVTVAGGKVADLHASGKVDTTTATNPGVSGVTTTLTTQGYLGAHSGLPAPPTAGIDNTIIHSRDYGQLGAVTARKNATSGAGTVNFTTSGASDDYCAAVVYFSEIDPPSIAGIPYLVMAPPIAA